MFTWVVGIHVGGGHGVVVHVCGGSCVGGFAFVGVHVGVGLHIGGGGSSGWWVLVVRWWRVVIGWGFVVVGLGLLCVGLSVSSLCFVGRGSWCG